MGDHPIQRTRRYLTCTISASSACASTGDLRTNAFGLPKEWMIDNYVSIATGARFWQMLGNSAFIAFVTVVLTLWVSSMAAFVLAHLHFWGKKWISNYLALGLTNS